MPIMTELEKYIQTYFPVATSDLGAISSFFKPLEVKKGEYFLKSGKYADKLGFVESGFMREYVRIEDREVTKWISSKGYFTVDLSSFLFQQTARWNIQALSDCQLHIIDKKEYQKLGSIIPQWAELEKLFIAKCFTVLEDRILTHLSMTAEERYLQLFQFNKELFNQIPLQYLASMLGMTPETLSRLRKKAGEKIS